MLQPRELKRAQGFPDDYEIRGNKTETTKQIGNAVPVTLAQRLVESLLSSSEPALTDYIDHEPATVEAGQSSVASGD
jgi:DNA (cytosine-5)-methyltransferase 1